MQHYHHVSVVTAPAPFVVPADIRNSTDDDTTAAVIAAVTRSIDGPTGWLGRSLGEQTLKLTSSRWPWRLAYKPVQSITSIAYTDVDGNEQTVPDTDYRLVGEHVVLAAGRLWPATDCSLDAVRTTYIAGYSEVPAEARHAVILAVQHLLDIGGRDLFKRREDVEGLGETEYVVSAAADETIRKATDRLLAGLRVWGN